MSYNPSAPHLKKEKKRESKRAHEGHCPPPFYWRDIGWFLLNSLRLPCAFTEPDKWWKSRAIFVIKDEWRSGGRDPSYEKLRSRGAASQRISACWTQPAEGLWGPLLSLLGISTASNLINHFWNLITGIYEAILFDVPSHSYPCLRI